MSPRGKRGELPKSVLRQQAIGYCPLNSLTVSYLAQGYGDTILGFCDTDETLAYKAKNTLTVKDGKTQQPVSLEGRFFNGYADALYRGRLPEVILAAPSADSLPLFLDDFAEYLEKLLSLGFFVPTKELIKKDPVSELIPCFILSGSGLLFSRFITGLVRYLRQMESRYPLLDEAIRTRIVGRFVRGIPHSQRPDIQLSFGETELGVRVTTCFDRLIVPQHFKIAGGTPHTQNLIQRNCTAQGFTITIENRTHNPVERLEFENALWRLSTVVLPSLAATQTLSSDAVDTLTSRVEAGILAIGRLRKAFEASEKPEQVLGSSFIKRGKDARKPAGTLPSRSSLPVTVKREDSDILAGLSQYAEALGLPDEQRLFQELADLSGQLLGLE